MLMICTACQSSTKVDNESENEILEEDVVEANAEPVELELTDYGEEMGFQMDAPPSEVFTTFSVNGSVEQVDQLKEDYVWVRSEERRVGKEWRFGGSAEHVLG